jgi:hypothetical protein
MKRKGKERETNMAREDGPKRSAAEDEDGSAIVPRLGDVANEFVLANRTFCEKKARNESV